MKKRIISIVMSMCLLVASLSITGCGEDTVKRIKQGVQDAQVYVNEALLIVDEYEAQGYISEAQATLARRILNDTKSAIETFTKNGASIKKVDWKSKQDLLKLFAAVTKGVDEFQAKAGPGIVDALEALNAAGVIKVNNPRQLVARVSAAIHGLNIAVGLVKSRLENIEVPDEPTQEKKEPQPEQPQATPDAAACLIPFPSSYQFA